MKKTYVCEWFETALNGNVVKMLLCFWFQVLTHTYNIVKQKKLYNLISCESYSKLKVFISFRGSGSIDNCCQSIHVHGIDEWIWLNISNFVFKSTSSKPPRKIYICFVCRNKIWIDLSGFVLRKNAFFVDFFLLSVSTLGYLLLKSFFSLLFS